VAATVAAAACLLAACTGSGPAAVSSGGPPLPSQSAPPVDGGGPPVPAHGAYVGAWVQPAVYTQGGKVAAVQQFQQTVGRQLDIVHVYYTWTQPFPTASDQEYASSGSDVMLSWAGTDTREIADGRYDSMIRARAEALKAWGQRVFLEWRWEMDRPNLSAQVGSGMDYVAAWIHIRKIFAQVGVTNVSWVWCPTATGFANGRISSYYPGDSQVDWICADAYPGSSGTSLADLMAPVMSWAAGHRKPVMIGEFGVRRQPGGGQAAWLTAAAEWVARTPAIKAIVYFDADYTDSHGNISPMALQTTPDSTRAFHDILANPYFDTQGRHVAPVG
jgi:hypothetical protein